MALPHKRMVIPRDHHAVARLLVSSSRCAYRYYWIHARFGFRCDGSLRPLQGLVVVVTTNVDLSPLFAHEVDRRLADFMGQEHRAFEFQDIGYAGCGDACVSARCDDKVRVRSMGPEDILGEMRDPSVFEGLGRLQVL